MVPEDFQPGEIVTLTLPGATVIGADEDEAGEPYVTVEVATPTGPALVVIPLGSQVMARRERPAAGPVQPGDVWRDGDGGVWMAYKSPYPTDPSMAEAGKGSGGYASSTVHREHRLVELLFRLPAEEVPNVRR